MGELGYGTRGPLVGKLKQLLADIQGLYEEFLDAQTLYQQGKMGEKEFFTRMGDFVKAFASLGFLTVKVILEVDAVIGKEEKKPEAVTTPAPSLAPEMMGQGSKPIYKAAEASERLCIHCNSKIPQTAKFCTSCGKPQG